MAIFRLEAKIIGRNARTPGLRSRGARSDRPHLRLGKSRDQRAVASRLPTGDTAG